MSFVALGKPGAAATHVALGRPTASPTGHVALGNIGGTPPSTEPYLESVGRTAEGVRLWLPAEPVGVEFFSRQTYSGSWQSAGSGSGVAEDGGWAVYASHTEGSLPEYAFEWKAEFSDGETLTQVPAKGGGRMTVWTTGTDWTWWDAPEGTDAWPGWGHATGIPDEWETLTWETWFVQYVGDFYAVVAPWAPYRQVRSNDWY